LAKALELMLGRSDRQRQLAQRLDWTVKHRSENLAQHPLGVATRLADVEPPSGHGSTHRSAVESVEGDLRSTHIKPGYDRHWGLL
jgi:hypothetical protein